MCLVTKRQNINIFVRYIGVVILSGRSLLVDYQNTRTGRLGIGNVKDGAAGNKLNR